MELVRRVFRTIGRSIVGFRVGNNYTKTSVGTFTLAAAATPDRNVLICVKVTETFATNSGTKPTFKIGQTGTTNKFADTGAFSGGIAGDILVFAGVLTGSDALLVTATAAVGAATGAIEVEAIVLPSTA